MPDVTFIGPSGQTYTGPEENTAEAISRGFKVVTAPRDPLSPPLFPLEHPSLNPGEKMKWIGPTGQAYDAPDDLDVEEAKKRGFTPETLVQRDLRLNNEENPLLQQYAAFGAGALKDVTGHSATEIIHALSSAALDAHKAVTGNEYPGEPEARLKLEQLRQQNYEGETELTRRHPIAVEYGRYLGEFEKAATSVALGGVGAGAEVGAAIRGGELAATAGRTALEEAGLTAVADTIPAAVETGTSGVLRNALASATEHGINSSLVASPQALSQITQGDYQGAAETLGTAALIGIVGGGSLSLLGSAGRAASRGIAGYLADAEENEAGGLLGTAKKFGGEKLDKFIDKSLSGRSIGGKAGTAIGGGLGAAIAGTYGAAGGAYLGRSLGQAAGEKFIGNAASDAAKGWITNMGEAWGDRLLAVGKGGLEEAAEAPVEKGFGSIAIDSANGALGKGLSMIPEAIAAIATGKPVKQKLSDAEVGKIATSLQNAASNPQALAEKVADITEPLNHNQTSQAVSLSVAQNVQNAVNYLAAKAPTQPVGSPFNRAGAEGLQDPVATSNFKRILSVAFNPMALLDHLRDGTITPDQVETVNTLYPKVYSMMQNAVQEVAASPNAPQLTSKQRQVLSIFMKSPMDATQTASNAQVLQAGFAPPSAPQGPQNGPGAPKGKKPRVAKLDASKFPSSLTGAQRTAFDVETG